MRSLRLGQSVCALFILTNLVGTLGTTLSLCFQLREIGTKNVGVIRTRMVYFGHLGC